MRTREDITTYCQKNNDFFGHTVEVLVPYLPFEQAKPYLIDSATPEEWKQTPLTREAALAEMKEYMAFAWDKVEDHRGLSADRSVTKMQAWLWLLGDEETLAYAKDEEHYAQYGAPILKKICEVYGFPIPEGSHIENMSQGKPCVPECDMGCGRGIFG